MFCLLHLNQTFPPIDWVFTEGGGDGIESRLPFNIFSTLIKVQLSLKKDKICPPPLFSPNPQLLQLCTMISRKNISRLVFDSKKMTLIQQQTMILCTIRKMK